MLIDTLEQDGLIIKGSGYLLEIFSLDEVSLSLQLMMQHAFVDYGITSLKICRISNQGNLLFVVRNHMVEYSWLDGSILSFKLLTELPLGNVHCTVSFVASESRIIIYTDHDIVISDRIVSKEKISLSSKTLTIITDYGIFKNIMKDDSDITSGIASSLTTGKVVLMKKTNLQSQLPCLEWGTWDFQTMKLKLAWRMVCMDDMISFSVFSAQSGDEFGVICTSTNACLVNATGTMCEIPISDFGFITALTPCRVNAQLQSSNLHYFMGVCTNSSVSIIYLVVDSAAKSLMVMPTAGTFMAVDGWGHSKFNELLPFVDRITFLSGRLDHAEELSSKTMVSGDFDYYAFEDGKTILLVETLELGLQIWAESSVWKHFNHAMLGRLHCIFSSYNDLSASNIITGYDGQGARVPLCAVLQNCADHAQLSLCGNVCNICPLSSQELDFGGVRDSKLLPVMEFLPTRPSSAGPGLTTGNLGNGLGLVLTSHLTKQSSLLVWKGDETFGSFELISSGFIRDEATINAFSIRNTVVLQVTTSHLCAFPTSINSHSDVSSSNQKPLWIINIHSLLNKYLQTSFPSEVKSIQDKRLTVSSAVLGHNILYLAMGDFIIIVYIALDQIPFSTGQASSGHISCVSKIDLLIEKQEVKRLHGISFSISSGSQTNSHHGVSCVLSSFWNICDFMVHTYFTSSIGQKTSSASGGSTMYKRDTSSFVLPGVPKATMITEMAVVACGSSILAFFATSIDKLYMVQLILPSSPTASGSVNQVGFHVLHILHQPNILSLVALPIAAAPSPNCIVPVTGCIAMVLPHHAELLQVYRDESHQGWTCTRSILYHHNCSSTFLIYGQIILPSDSVSSKSPYLSLLWMTASDGSIQDTENRSVLYQGRVEILGCKKKPSSTFDFALRCDILRSMIFDGTVRGACFNQPLSVVVGILDSTFEVDKENDADFENWCEEADVMITVQRETVEQRQGGHCKDIFIASLGDRQAVLKKIGNVELLRLPVATAMKSIFESLQHSKSILPMQLCAMSADPFDSNIVTTCQRSGILSNANKRISQKETFTPLCHVVCVDSWKWEDIPGSESTSSADPIIVNTLHFLTLGLDEDSKSFVSLSHVSYDFFDVEIMRHFQRGNSMDAIEDIDFGSRLQLCSINSSAIDYDKEQHSVNSKESDTFLVILTQDGKLQVLGWKSEIRKRDANGSGLSIEFSEKSSEMSSHLTEGIEVNAQDMKEFESVYVSVARVTVIASCLTVTNSEYYYFFNQHEEATAGLATQSKFARDKLFHQYINEMSLGQYDLYQGMAVHDCFIVVGICLFGLKLYRLCPASRELLTKSDNERRYEIKPLTETIDKAFQMMTFWTITKRGDEGSPIFAVVKVFGFERSEVMTAKNVERKFIRLVTYWIFSEDQPTVSEVVDGGNSSSSVRTDTCFAKVPSLFTKVEVAKIVPRCCIATRKFSSEELEVWGRQTDIGELIQDSFDVFDCHGNICKV